MNIWFESHQTIINLGASIFTILSILYYIIRSLTIILNSLKIPDHVSGLYSGTFSQNNKEILHKDFIIIKKTLRGFKGETFYSHTLNFDYCLTIKKTKYSKNVYEGKWYNKHTKETQGFIQVKLYKNHEKTTFTGGWSGPNQNETINYGEFKLVKTNVKLNSKPNKPDISNNTIISDIVKDHEANSSCEVFIKDLHLSITPGSFNPSRGKISEKLLDCVIKEIGIPESVLDIGCGSGFYALYFAKNGSSRVNATELSQELIESAKLNASKNAINTEAINFTISHPKQLYHKIDSKFDLIIANLPFTAKENCKKHKKSDYYSCFAADRLLYINLLLGAKFHLKETGFLYFTFSQSGYEKDLFKYFEIANLEYRRVERIEEKDDIFYIYKASLKK